MPQADIEARKNFRPALAALANETVSEQEIRTKRDEAMDRIAAANASKPIGHYVRWGPTGIEEVLCKECGTPVRGLVVHPGHQERRSINGKMVIFERMVLATFPLYTEVTIDFNDGSHHVTVSCADCAKNLTLADIEWHYATDMLEMDIETKGELRWQYFANRIPTAFHISYVGPEA